MTNEELVLSTAKDITISLIEHMPEALQLGTGVGDARLIELGKKFNFIVKSVSKTLESLDV